LPEGKGRNAGIPSAAVTTEIEGEPECWGRVCVQLKVIVVVVVVVDVRGGGG